MNWLAFNGFTRPQQRRRWTATWANVTQWQESLEGTLQVRRSDLVKRRQAWDAALRDFDLRDPSAVDRTTLRVLRLSREEDWSDWLAQLVEDSRGGSFTTHLFGAKTLESFAIKRVHREVSSYQGWRADIIVEWQDCSYTHMEVKVGDPNLDKTLDTAYAIEQRFQGQRRRGDFILLLPEQCEHWDQRCLENARLAGRILAVTWIDVARALRTALRAGDESVAWRIWAHAFCGAIEQKLLGIPAGDQPHAWVQRLRLRQLSVAHELLHIDEVTNA